MVKLNDNLALASIISVAVFYPVIGENSMNIPSQNYSFYDGTQTTHQWEEQLDNLPYRVDTEHISAVEQITVMNHIVSELLENAVEIEPAILKAVDEEFWNLI